ncbi:family A G protein-coupled receptor-like protein [Xylariaceae sp. AK1471]|nr:family A G protein-coupled receptor-like protein [Xylariaceae sp. AK1471]
MSTTISPGVLRAIAIIERVGSVFSLTGCMFIIVTFLASSAFHKPINRLVFYASFGNVATSIATLIARAYTHELNSAGCQIQGFLIQQFLPADALWTLAMAFNVYLTFYHKFDAQKLRMIEKWYLLVCYGLPLPPALIFIFISTESRGRIYGDAVLWCWVDAQWEVLRIATFYGPVWLILLATFFIYIRAGREIYEKRRQLRKAGNSSSQGQSGHDLDGTKLDMLHSMKTTEITVTSESAHEVQQGVDDGSLRDHNSKAPSESQAAGAYSITISSERQARIPPINPEASTNRGLAKAKRRNNNDANNAAWSYTKCAILFFTALLITWIPSSANRVYSVVHGGDAVVVLQVLSAIVLPLQGFWNAIIYAVTSWAAVKLFFSELFHRDKHDNTASPYSQPSKHRHNFSFTVGGRNRRDGETDSMTELAGNARPISKTS